MRLLRLVALVTACALALGGCGSIKERKERADRIIDSVDKTIAARSAQLSVSSTVAVRLDRAQLLGGAPAGGAAPPRTFEAQADLGRDRVAFLYGVDGGAPEAVRIYAGTTVYSRRLDPSAKSSERPWVRLDLRSIDPDEIDNDDIVVTEALRRLGEIQTVENPLFLLKLLRGTLSGSVDDLGEDDVRGVPTTHYRLNIDREKAVKDDDEDVQDAYEAMFKSMFATRTVFPGEVWLDDQGLPRRYAVTLKSNVRRRPLADVRLTVELFDVGRPVRIALPEKRETVEVEDLGNLTQAVTGGA